MFVFLAKKKRNTMEIFFTLAAISSNRRDDTYTNGSKYEYKLGLGFYMREGGTVITLGSWGITLDCEFDVAIV